MNKCTIEIDRTYLDTTDKEMENRVRQILKEKENIEPKVICLISMEYNFKHNTVKYKFEYE